MFGDKTFVTFLYVLAWDERHGRAVCEFLFDCLCLTKFLRIRLHAEIFCCINRILCISICINVSKGDVNHVSRYRPQSVTFILIGGAHPPVITNNYNLHYINARLSKRYEVYIVKTTLREIHKLCMQYKYGH